MSSLLTKLVADFETQLATAISVGGTTATLLSETDDDGNTIPDGNYILTLERTSSNKEYVRCVKTGASLTSIQSLSRQGALTTGCVRAHRIGSTVTITDWSQLKYLTDLLSGTTDLDSTDPLKYDGTASITNDAHLATKKYVDDTAIAGSPKATDSVYGITKLSVAAASATDPIAVGDNDTRVPTQNENDALAGISGTPSSSDKYATNTTINDIMPIGTILDYGGSTAPSSTWLLCQGQAISRTTYATLFARLGTAFGTGDGSTTFNIPDARGRVTVMQDGTTDFDVIGETGGAKTHTLIEAEMPSHTHSLINTAGTNTTIGGNATYASNSTTGATGATGGNSPHNNLQPYIVTNKIIRVI